MRLDRDLFQIDSPAAAEKLCSFIREKQIELNRDGILVPFSGGLDSTTVLLLCLRAVGRENLKAVLLPEKQGNPDAQKYAERVARRFEIDTITRDISPVLDRLGVYDYVLAKIPLRPLRELTAKTYMQAADESVFLKLLHGQAAPLERKGFARFNAKHRVRKVIMYLLAEEMNDLVVGSAHKTEDMLGLYVKFGVDDSADLMPLKNLYRSQILQLAEFLGVPGEIIRRTPNPDIIPGVSDKYVDLIGLPSDKLDLLVYGIEKGLVNEDIAQQLALDVEKVQEIRDLVAITCHMRQPSQTVEWE